jgi:hypothetical protein
MELIFGISRALLMRQILLSDYETGLLNEHFIELIKRILSDDRINSRGFLDALRERFEPPPMSDQILLKLSISVKAANRREKMVIRAQSLLAQVASEKTFDCLDGKNGWNVFQFANRGRLFLGAERNGIVEMKCEIGEKLRPGLVHRLVAEEFGNVTHYGVKAMMGRSTQKRQNIVFSM